MARSEKADLRGIGSYEKHSTSESKRFFVSDYRQFKAAVQCRHCDSDYLRFAVDGYCQRCQQRSEYVLRERPATAERARSRRAY
jgi:hypothetical protein